MNKKERQWPVNLVMIILCTAVLMPFLLVVSISLSNEKDIIMHGYSILPKHIDFAGYRYVFKNPSAIINAYKVTIIFSVVTTVFSLLLMAMISYALSRKFLWGRRGIAFYLYFTMMFGGGLVPTYIFLTQYLHLGNNILVYILPGLISPWYVFMMRSSMSQIPEALMESAYIDGASEYRVFFQIILPMSKPTLAAVSLFVFLCKWNDWYTALIYINDEKLISLQYLLQRIINNTKILQDQAAMSTGLINVTEIPTETARMAMAIIVAGPALFIFPFFQKYFVKGISVGSVKG